MAFPPRLFVNLVNKDVHLFQQTFDIPISKAYSAVGLHYFDMNLFYGESSGRLEMAKRLAKAVQSIAVAESSSLPVASCLLIVTYAAIVQHESRWRSAIADVVREDAERNAGQVGRVLKASERISARVIHGELKRMLFWGASQV
jgi:hypothetical protein